MHRKYRLQRGIPPLTWLRAFEAASRHLSFKNAAEELNVTPASVSQQVRQLEDYYEVRLFDRHTRSVTLTRVGELAVPLLTTGMSDLISACDAIQNYGSTDAIVVTAPPSFSMKWLMPRMEEFRDRYPEIEIRIDARDELVDFRTGSADLGIRYGTGKYSDLYVEPLIADEYFPVCSPRLLEQDGPLHRLIDIDRYRLLHVDWPALNFTAPSWDMWLQAANISHEDVGKGHRFTSEMMAMEAAISGMGIALISSTVTQTDINAGRLLRVFEDRMPLKADFHYYLVYRNDVKQSHEAEVFCSWLREALKRPASQYTNDLRQSELLQ